MSCLSHVRVGRRCCHSCAGDCRRPSTAQSHHKVRARMCLATITAQERTSEADGRPLQTRSALAPSRLDRAQQLQQGMPKLPLTTQISQYSASEFVEIGFVWKAFGVRGEVAVRVITSLQDYRVGIPGYRHDTLLDKTFVTAWISLVLFERSHVRTLRRARTCVRVELCVHCRLARKHAYPVSTRQRFSYDHSCCIVMRTRASNVADLHRQLQTLPTVAVRLV